MPHSERHVFVCTNEQVWYGAVTESDSVEIVDNHLIGGEVVTRLTLPEQPHLAPGVREGVVRLPVINAP
jgi:(2Fe-2S) ferredoxin